MAHPPKSSANFSTSRTLLLGSSLTPALVTTLPLSYMSSFTTVLHHTASVLLDQTS
ncbi:hypothetical protein LDENG_00285480 [Lucifuga dentata]|nr:hypothetical protein LDENG_00285480 [Lucifuga dentata]